MITPDLFAEVVAALVTAADELDLLDAEDNGIDWPVPDDLQGLLDERLALLATLSWLKGRLPAEDVEKLKAEFRRHREAARADYEMPRVPVLPEVKEAIERVLGDLRRAAILDREVGDVVREAGLQL